MSDLEKINIYIPDQINNIIENDARMFEILKADGISVNRNRFISMLLTGYYETYSLECQNIAETVLNDLSKRTISESEKRLLASSLINRIITVGFEKREKTTVLSYKPTNDTEGIVNCIMNEISEKDSLSSYFKRMLISYCKKSFSERERIVFKEKYELLNDACIQGKAVKLSLISDSKTFHEVIPYMVTSGKEEMFNYLLCSERDKETGEEVTRSYRLNRISKIYSSRNKWQIEEKNKLYLKRMSFYSPQFAINSSDPICVRLNVKGEFLFNRIYHLRPMYYKIEPLDEGALYYFDCSEDQIFLYFRKFESNAAEIIEPERLRARIIKSFEDNIKTYKGDTK